MKFKLFRTIMMSGLYRKVGLIVFQAGLIVFLAGYCFAQGSSVPALQSLSYSLQELKASAGDLRQKNYWLDSESQNLQKEIELLKRELTALQNGEYQPTATELNVKADGQYHQRQVRRVNETGTDFGEVYVKNETVISYKNKKEDELKQAIATVQKEVDWLKSKLGKGADGQGRFDYTHEEEQFIALIKDHQKQLQEVRKKIIYLEKKYDKPLKDFEDLSAEHERLTQYLKVTREDYAAVLEDERRINDELANLNQTIENEYEALSQDIAKLKEKDVEVKRVLGEAKQKLSAKNIDFDSYQSEHVQLEENLFVIKNENVNLKEQIVSLEKKLEQMK